MKSYLISLVLILTAGCAHNWLNLKQSEMILQNDRVEHPTHRLNSGTVATYYGALGDESIDAYKQAIDIINEKAGCTIFEQPFHSYKDHHGYGVELRCWNRIADPDFLGPDLTEEEDYTRGVCINHHVPGTDIIAYSITYIPCYRPFKEIQVRTAVHELLHSLGFGHDRELGTILYHSAKFVDDEFQEEDIYIIKNYYCKKKELKDVLGEI